MTQTMTLVQAARQIEQGGTKIKIGNFDSIEDFLSYLHLLYAAPHPCGFLHEQDL